MKFFFICIINIDKTNGENIFKITLKSKSKYLGKSATQN